MAIRIDMTRLVRPTEDTRFHIEYDWWTREGRDLHVHLRSICDTFNVRFRDDEDPTALVDWVDPDTGQVQTIDLALYKVRTVCARQPDYITNTTPLVEAVFRLFLANGNRPLTVAEIVEKIDRPGQEHNLLRTLSSARVYQGVRPFLG